MKLVFEYLCWGALLALLIFVSLNPAHAGLKVAIIDSGLDLNDIRFIGHLCKSGHKNFTDDGLEDRDGHGTHVAGLIVENAKDSDYCLVILKVVDRSGTSLLSTYLKALQEAVNQHVDIVNISLTAEEYDQEEERLLCGKHKTTFSVAAGNEGNDLMKKPMYPAALVCNNIHTVGATDYRGSNYGPNVKYWEAGYNVLSYAIGAGLTEKTGTSMSTAIHTGKLVYERSH